MITYINLRNGYVESNSIASLSFFHEEGFKTKAEAIQNLADTLLKAYDLEYPVQENIYKSCCIKAKENGCNYCPECGHTIINKARYRDYFGWLYGLLNDDANSFFAWECLEEAGWSVYGDVWKLKESNCLIISEFGAETLFHYTLKNKGLLEQDRKNLEAIYKEEVYFDIEEV